jgi:hypothetical protein
MILLGTDVMIDFLRQYPLAVAWLDSIGEEAIVLPGIEWENDEKGGKR